MVLPVVIMLSLGLVVWGLGVFRYHQVADLARAATRYAATHGGAYAREANRTVTGGQIVEAAVAPRAVGLSPRTVTISIVTSDGTARAWDDAYWDRRSRTYDLQTDIGTGKFNRVRVTVSHEWFPGVFGAGSITLRSTSEMQMIY